MLTHTPAWAVVILGWAETEQAFTDAADYSVHRIEGVYVNEEWAKEDAACYNEAEHEDGEGHRGTAYVMPTTLVVETDD